MERSPDKNLGGLVIRPFHGEGDFAPMAAVLTASEAADGLERNVDAEDVAEAFKHLRNCDPQQDLIIAEVLGEMVGYVRGWWEDGDVGERWYCHVGFLMPAFRRKGIGSVLLSIIENRLRVIAAGHDQHAVGAQQAVALPEGLGKIFQVSIPQNYTGRMALMEHAGYQAVRYYYSMVRPTLEDIPSYPLPAGLELRQVQPAQTAAIWQVLCETSRDEWGHRELTDQDYQDWLNSPFYQPELWQVAWDTSTNQPVGTVLTYIHHEQNKQFNRLRGYTEGIGVVQSWRRRGVARALISLSLQAQKAAGMSESALVVDSQNEDGALGLYQSCGFQVDKRDTLYRKPFA